MTSRAERKKRAEKRVMDILTEIGDKFDAELGRKGVTTKQALLVVDKWLYARMKEDPNRAADYRKAANKFSKILDESIKRIVDENDKRVQQSEVKAEELIGNLQPKEELEESDEIDAQTAEEAEIASS